MYYIYVNAPADNDYGGDGLPDIADTHPGETEDVNGDLGNPGCGKPARD